MGSCYSTKSNQMPHQQVSTNSPGVKRSLPKPNFGATQPIHSASVGSNQRDNSQNGRSIFGFKKPNTSGHARALRNESLDESHIHVGAAKKGDEKPKTSVSKGCSTENSSQASRFGLKKPSITVSTRSNGPSVSRSSSVRSGSSVKSSGSAKSSQLARPTQVNRSYGDQSSSIAKISKTNEIPMIDDTGTNSIDSASNTSSIQNASCISRPRSKPDLKTPNASSKIGGSLSMRSAKEDRLNANITNSSEKTRKNNVSGNNVKNENETHSDTKQKVTSRIQSGLQKPSNLSKPYSAVRKNAQLNKDNDNAAQKQTSQPCINNSNIPANSGHSKKGALSFLRRMPFSRQRSSTEKSSQEGSKNMTEVSESLKNTDSIDKTNPVETEPFKSLNFTSKIKDEKCENIGDTSQQQDIIDSMLNPDDDLNLRFSSTKDSGFSCGSGDVSTSPTLAGNTSEPIAVPTSTSGVNVGSRAPDTYSLGSLASDDLMLDIEVDLAGYDEDSLLTDDAIDPSPSAATVSKAGAMRARSNSYARRRVRTFSGGDEKLAVPATHDGYRAAGDAAQKFGSERMGERGGGASAGHKRDSWRGKRASVPEEGLEALSELGQLMDQQHMPVTRRAPRLNKATRPASFPGLPPASLSSADPTGSNAATSIDTGAVAVGSAPTAGASMVLRPPRTSAQSGSVVAGGVAGEDRVVIDALQYRQMTQEFTFVKTMLHKLKRLLQNDELSSPLTTTPWKNRMSFSQPSSPQKGDGMAGYLATVNPAAAQDSTALTQENGMLREQVRMLQHTVEEQERTIKLLQQQMTKYVCGLVEGGRGVTHRAVQTHLQVSKDGQNWQSGIVDTAEMGRPVASSNTCKENGAVDGHSHSTPSRTSQHKVVTSQQPLVTSQSTGITSHPQRPLAANRYRPPASPRDTSMDDANSSEGFDDRNLNDVSHIESTVDRYIDQIETGATHAVDACEVPSKDCPCLSIPAEKLSLQTDPLQLNEPDSLTPTKPEVADSVGVAQESKSCILNQDSLERRDIRIKKAGIKAPTEFESDHHRTFAHDKGIGIKSGLRYPTVSLSNNNDEMLASKNFTAEESCETKEEDSETKREIPKALTENSKSNIENVKAKSKLPTFAKITYVTKTCKLPSFKIPVRK